ncbi:MAG: hypothetical protein V4490_03145, partial [Pseudomonadota bacterium]
MNKNYRSLPLLLFLSLATTSHADTGTQTTTHDNETLTNTGFISVNTIGNAGLSSAYAGATLINAASGLISATATSSNGIATNEANSNIVNNGNITGSGAGGFGVITFGSQTNIENNGTIVSTGLGGGGFFPNESYTTTSNTGTVTVTGTSSTGIWMYAPYNTFNNTGTMTDAGIGVYTVVMGNTNQTVNNSGLLTATGVNAKTVYSNSSSTVIINSGSILNSGTASAYAIDLAYGNYGLVRLDSGSIVAGAINSGDGSNTLTFNLGAGKSYHYALAGAWTVTDANQRPFDFSNGQAASPGLGVQQQASHGQVYRALHIGNTVQRRLYNKSQADFAGVARTPSSRLISKTSFTGDQFAQDIWVEPYVSYSRRGSDASEPTVVPYHLSEAGLTLGTSFNNYLKGAEAIVNIDNSQLNVDSGN